MPGFDPHTIEMAILRELSDGNNKHKFNLIGRPYQAGTLEHSMQSQFTNEDRELADRAFESLRTKSMIRPTYSDLVEPERWVEITEKGKDALKRGVLDDLDAALLKIHPNLVEIRAGAWEAVYSNGADSLRQAAHSGRELIDQVLKEGAPEVAIKSDPTFVPDNSSKSGVTRRHRFKYLMKTWRRTDSNTDLGIAEEAFDLVRAVNAKLQGGSHTRDTLIRQEVIDALEATEIALRALLT